MEFEQKSGAPAEDVIVLSGVGKKYGKSTVLKDVSFSVPKGSVFGLVGRNGAGKTTLMRLMTGLQNCDEGKITMSVTGNRIGSVGAIVELASIYTNMSARDNLVFQYMNLGRKVDESLDELLAFVGLADTGKKHAGKFSLGMRQRLGIAVALVGDPELLVLDEPVNGLDPQGILEVRNLLLKLSREKGITIVISSHILSELSKLATHYAFIEEGRVVKTATAHEIENAGKKFSRVTCDDTEKILPVLEGMGFEPRIIAQDKVEFEGEAKLTTLVTTALDAGVEISKVETEETDLERFFVGLVGGDTNV
ncbi:MAG: ATP-binding cassette domain-containing protein [Clostridiales bacterium]|nr:ATP-binding cassette domain-containing protein [Clostridiales bacterium]